HEDHPYQFVKLLITFSPLHALGAVALAASLSRLLAGGLRGCPASRVGAAVPWLPVLVAAATAAAGTARMAFASADPDAVNVRTNQHAALDADFRHSRLCLEDVKDYALLVRPSNNFQHYRQGWALYFARHNRVW